LAVDVANVCRDGSLPGAVALSRLDLVLDAWRSQICRYVEVLMVVDKSLMRELSRTECKRIKLLRRQGELWIRRRDADDLLLNLAEDKNACVLSRDRFLDKRRGRRWDPARFYDWTVEESMIRVRRRPPQNTQPYDISRKEEQALARSRGILDLRHPALRRRWSCVSTLDCETRQATPDFLQALPALEAGVVVCPGCGHPLLDRGIRPSQAELKLVVDEVEVARFTLTQGETISFGRTLMPHTPKLVLAGRRGKLADVGREHLDLRLVGKRVAVRPVDDGHRVWVRRWDSGRRRFAKRAELRHGDGFTRIGLRDVLMIGKRLELQRSGRSIAEAELPLGQPAEEEPWGAWQTSR